MRIVGIFTCTAVVVLSGGAVYSQQANQPAIPRSFNSTHPVQQNAGSAFWTQDRQNDAQEAPAPVLDAKSLKKSDSSATRPSGLTATNPKGLAGAVSDANVDRLLGGIGRFYFMNNDGKNQFCSGALVASGVLLVPAHCVRDQNSGRFWTNMVFRQGSRPYNVECAATWTDYVGDNPSQWQYSYGVVKLRGANNLNYFGTQRISSQHETAATIKIRPADQTPRVELNHGEIVQTEYENVAGLQFRTPDPNGGAWINDKSLRVGAFVIGITAFKVDGQPAMSYSPVLNEAYRELVRHASNGCR